MTTQERTGQYLSQKEVYQLTSPPTAAVERTVRWLKSVQPKSVTVRNNGGFVAASMTVDQASLLLSEGENFNFFRFQHAKDSQRFVIRSNSPIMLPEEIHRLVQLVDGVNRFPCASSLTLLLVTHPLLRSTNPKPRGSICKC